MKNEAQKKKERSHIPGKVLENVLALTAICKQFNFNRKGK
jgi:hypothetical protein